MNLTDALSIKIGTADAVDVRLGSVSVWSGESLAETFLTYDSSSLGTLRNPDNSSRTITSAHTAGFMSSVLDSEATNNIGWWPGNWSGGGISSTNTTEWLQIDLGENQNVTGVVAQGYRNRELYYVNKYRVEYCIENSIQFSVSGMAAGTSSDTYFNSSTVSHYEVNGTYGGKIQYVASGESDSSIRYRSSDNKWEFVNDGDEYYISDTTNNDNPWAVTSWSVHPGDGSGDTNSEIVLSVDQNTFTDIDSGAEFNYDNEGDGNTKIYNSFATPVTARYITIFPTGYQGLPIMRAGVLTDGVEIQLIPEFSGSSTVDWGDDTATDALVNNASVSHAFNPFIDSTGSASPTYDYDATPAATSINEGSALTINVTTTNVSDSTTLYWTILGNTGDFSTTSDSFTITSNAGSFTVTPDADSTTESSETFQVQIRTGSESGTIVDTTDAITINDTSQTPAFTPDFELTIGSPSTGLYSVAGTDQNGSVNANNPTLAFNQGDKVRFNNGVSSSHPLYITTSSGSISNLASGVSGAGTATVDWTIPSAGTYYYQCQVHSSMYGQITVT